MLHVLLALSKNGSSNYTRCITMQLLVLIHQKKNNTPAYQMLANNLAVFNEEAGEMCFSVLARCVLGDSMKSKFEHLNSMYTLLHTYMAIADDIVDDQDMAGPSRNWRKRIDPEGEEVTAVKAWFKMTLRRIKHNNFRQYDGTPNSYQSAAAAAKHMTQRTSAGHMFHMPTILAKRDHVFKSVKASILKNTLTVCMVPIWPEFEHKLPPSELDRIEYVGDDEDAEDADEWAPDTPPPPEAGAGKRKQLSDSDSDMRENSPASEAEQDPEEKKHDGSRDFDARGDRVNWDEWLRGDSIKASNILPGTGRPRRYRPEVNLSKDHPYVRI